MCKGEIIIYRETDHADFQIDVRVQDETVWLNRLQMTQLFGRDVKTIGKHINNALNEELQGISVVAKFATTASDSKTYSVEYYNLDVIISVGYRVKSKRGVQFRRWANKILKEYLLKEQISQKRLEKVENEVADLKKKITEISFQIRTELPPKQGVLFDGQVFEAHKFISDIVRSAEKSIVLIDNYVDDTVLTLFSKRKRGVVLKILTKNLSKQLILDIHKFNEQFPPAEIKEFNHSHDRFMIIDDRDLYHFGASLKDLGRKWFGFSKMDIEVTKMLARI
ncbi:MAG: RhuM family protein [bacterium]|jgi:sugar-specific transcriptional regulator TrmB|nr:RhuM family protein [bacterium]